MNQLQLLREQIAHLPLLPAEEEMGILVANYLAARGSIEALVDQQAQVKARMRQISNETGVTEWRTLSGSVIAPADSVIVTYDAKALDGVRQMSKTVNRYILPHRRETFKAGGIRISPYER